MWKWNKGFPRMGQKEPKEHASPLLVVEASRCHRDASSTYSAHLRLIQNILINKQFRNRTIPIAAVHVNTLFSISF